ncbi:MAG: hypothetical protein AAB049_00635 [Nitrospirota bacterium]
MMTPKSLFRLLTVLVCMLAWAQAALAQEATLEILPVRPINFDAVFRQQTFAPDDREITIQAGLTALRYGNLEVRGLYRYFSYHAQEQGVTTDQNALMVNPRWNNFIDVLNFPAGKPINRMLRHALFGPLEDRAVPYLGLLAGGIVPGRGASGPGYLFGGQVGVRFPLAFGVSLDVALEYSQSQVNFQGADGISQQWVMTTGIRF